MNKDTGEIRETDAPNPATEIGITKKEMEMLEKVPFDLRVRDLGAIRHGACFKDRLIRVGRVKSFQEGYDFAMAIHQLPALNKADMPTEERPAETVDKALKG